MGKKKDLAWKYCELVEPPPGERNSKKSYVYTRCKFCHKMYKESVKRQNNHLARTHKNDGPCTKASDDVKKEMKSYLKNTTTMKQLSEQHYEEMISSNSCVGQGDMSLMQEGDISIPKDAFNSSSSREVLWTNGHIYNQFKCRWRDPRGSKHTPFKSEGR